MTTAHRPTWAPAKGGGTARDLGRTQQFSSRDLPGHMNLKLRQAEEEPETRDLKAELRRKEEEARSKRRRHHEPEEEEEEDTKAPRLLDAETAALDADDADQNDDDDDDSDDSDEDDTAELLAELERIKKERALEQARKEAEEAQAQELIRTENLLQGNPLLHQAGDFTIKKRWDDDVVFKNCARGVPDKKTPSYVNDTIRSEFHRKFMKNSMAWLLLPASTERLRLRRLTDSDLPPFVGYRSCREVARLQSWTEDFGLEQAQALLRSQDSNSWGQPDTWYQTAIADKTTDTLLGDIALHFPPAGSRVLEVGFTVAPEHQGKGYASEALRCVLTAAAEGGEVEKVVAYTDVRNTAARRLLERVGFVQEGEPSEATFKGEVCLEVCYVYVVGSCPRG